MGMGGGRNVRWKIEGRNCQKGNGKKGKESGRARRIKISAE